MKIQLKRSNVLNGGVAKEPTAAQMEYGELAVNYNAADPAIFLEDDTGAIIRIAGKGSISSGDVPSGGTPPNSGNQVGDLFFDTTLNQLLYWDGSEWKPVSSELNDLTDVILTNPTEDDLLVYNGSEWVNANPGYLTEAEVINILEGNNPDGTNKPDGEEYAKLSDIGDGKITIVDADGNPVGEFTVNQEGDTEIILPEDQIHIGDTYPGTPSLGDLWVDTSECPPVLQIWNDCDGTEEWKPIGGRPVDAITFTPVITDDGTPSANTPGHILTASAQNIQGGTAPVEYEYKWLVDGLTMGTNKTLNIIQTFVGKVVSCEVTVAEPDGSNPETRTATYAQVIEVAGTIDTPEVLAPADGAGSGTSRYLKSDTIIDVEDVGGGQIKLTVDGSTDLADMSGASFMSDGTGAPGPYSQTPYKLVTSEITDVQKDSQADWTGLNNLYGSDSTYVAGGGTNGSVVNKEYAFNGNVPGINNVSKSQNAYSDNGAASIIYWRPDPALIQSIFGDLTSIRIRIDAVGGRTINNVLWLNGANVEVTSSEYGKGALGNDAQWLSVDTVPTSLTADGIAVQGGNVSTGRIGAIELNGILLVDNSELITLTFASPNPDLKYFKSDDVIYTDPDDGSEVKVISTGYPNSNTMVVDGGAWDDSDHSKAWSSYFANYTIVPNITTGIPSNAFDGTDNTVFSSQHYSDTLVWEYPSGYTFTDKVEIYFYHSQHTVKVNNSATAIDIDEREWVTVATGGGTLQKLTVENTIAVGAPVKSWAMLRIDGNLLIDKANKTKVWSQYGSGNHHSASYNWESVFSYGTAGGYPAVTDSITWTPDGGFEFDREFAISSKVGYSNMDRPDRILPVITGEFETAGPFEIFRDDSRFAGTATSYVKLADGPDKLISFTVYNNGNGAYDAAQLFSVFGDGEQLIDTGVLGIGLDRAEYQTNGGEGEIVSVNTDDNTIMLTETGDRDNRWIAENKAGTDFYVAGPQIVDDPLLTTDVELESSLFATTPDNADTLKNIVWELNGAEQNAGTSNPYKPSGLALNTEYTVRVKHQGNALEDSAWSPSTTFTTGATRNLYTYYKERVDALVARVEALENP